ncbi:hypothetical protein BSKO_10599 [Bryopsis sp. KO-2023]|nr:hypothetical protein BSKO_10599 [Bryopsis sp. KO-2023]
MCEKGTTGLLLGNRTRECSFSVTPCWHLRRGNLRSPSACGVRRHAWPAGPGRRGFEAVERVGRSPSPARFLGGNAVQTGGGAASSADAPTWFERTVAALMYVLPLSEGFYRLALVTVRFCKRHALEFLFWCHMQLRQVTVALSSRAATDYTREDAVALETLMQMSRRIHTWFSEWFDQLLNLSAPLRPGRGDSTIVSWASSTFTTPEALWHLCWLSCMSVVAVLAGFRLHNRRVGKQQPNSTDSQEKPEGSGWKLFRKPEVVTGSYFCALLMRVSWAPLQGMSDLSLELYCLGATLLTVITTVAGLAQVHKLLFGNLVKVSRCLEGMVEQVTGVAQLHRSLLLLDWVLCLFSSQVLETKCLRSLMLAVYWMTVTTLESEAQSSRQMPKHST